MNEPETTAAESVTQSELNNLHEMVSKLDKSVSKLIGIIDPVRNPHPQCESKGEEKNPPESMSHVASVIREATFRVGDIITRVNVTCGEVEL